MIAAPQVTALKRTTILDVSHAANRATHDAAGMTRTGTRRRDRIYSYYSCGGCHQKGKSACLIAQVEVGDDKVRIIGEKASLAAVIAGNPPESAHVRGFVRKWRARRVSNS